MSEFNPTPEPSKKHPYQKLGGWLLVFVVSDFISLPLRIASLLLKIKRANDFTPILTDVYERSPERLSPEMIAAMNGYQPAWGDFLPLIASIVFLVMAILIVRRNPRFLLLYQLYCPFAIALFLATGFADGLFARLVEISGITLALVGIITVTLLVAGGLYLNMLYFFRSVRVRTYMGSDEYLRLAFFTKKIKGPEPAVPDTPTDFANTKGATYAGK